MRTVSLSVSLSLAAGGEGAESDLSLAMNNDPPWFWRPVFKLYRYGSFWLIKP